MLPGQEPCQDMDRGQPCIARGDAVVTLDFEEAQEPFDSFGGEITDTEMFDSFAAVVSSELQRELPVRVRNSA